MQKTEKDEKPGAAPLSMNGVFGRIRRLLNAPRPGYHYFIVITSAVFAAEFMIMLILAALPALPAALMTVLDPLVLITALTPALYFFLLKPLADQVRERARAETLLRESEKKFREFVSMAQEGIWVIDRDGYTTFVNPRMAQMLGYAREEMAGMHIFNFIDEKNVEQCKINLERRKAGIREQHDFELLRKDGARIYAAMAVAPLNGENGDYTGAIAGVMDITERMQMENDLHRLVTTDTLTGAYSRSKFSELFELEKERAKRFALPMSLLILDIDGFKQINDICGHLAGDHVLKTVASLVKGHKRAVDHLIRWGGDEFLILSAHMDLEHAHAQGERFRKIINDFTFEHAGKVTVSLGVAQFGTADDADSLLERADRALYTAKSAGKNCVRAAA